MSAAILSFDSYRHLDTFQYPQPKWVAATSVISIHTAPTGLNAVLVKELGEAKHLIGHCIALARAYGVAVNDFTDLWNAIFMSFGQVDWSDKMMEALEAQIECPGLDRQAAETLAAWSSTGVPKTGARSAYEFFRSCLVTRRSQAWRPMSAVLRHAVLLIEAARLGAGKP
jgi:hypothetical protein